MATNALPPVDPFWTDLRAAYDAVHLSSAITECSVERGDKQAWLKYCPADGQVNIIIRPVQVKADIVLVGDQVEQRQKAIEVDREKKRG